MAENERAGARDTSGRAEIGRSVGTIRRNHYRAGRRVNNHEPKPIQRTIGATKPGSAAPQPTATNDQDNQRVVASMGEGADEENFASNMGKRYRDDGKRKQ